MKRVPSVIWALLVFGGFWAFLEFGVPMFTAPLPSSLTMMYVGMTLLGILLYLSVTEDRWAAFIEPIEAFLRKSSPARNVLLAVIPLGLGYLAYARAAATPDPPGDPPGVHFNLPGKYVSVENPLPWTAENIREGGVLYMQNCAMCHGDALDGNGIFARAWQPRPANFRKETIDAVDENYVFWRIKEGGPGVPKGSIEYRSTMPIWDGVLSDEQIWKIIMFEYTNAGVKPATRAME